MMFVKIRTASIFHLVLLTTFRSSDAFLIAPVRSASSSSMWSRLWQAAPGVQMASAEEIRKALANPETTVIDARTIEEMQKDGYFNASTCRFIHAPATKTEAPLLQLAAKSLLPQKDAPVVIYCGSGIRATTAKQVLDEAGYTNVLNAGGLSDIQSLANE